MTTPLSLDLLSRSEESLDLACHATVARERYLQAHLAALRAAAALVGSRGGRAPHDPRVPYAGPGGPTRRGLWTALAVTAPELGEWASYFAATGRRSRRVVRGEPTPISPRDADDLVRAAQTFLTLAAGRLGAARDAVPARLTPLTH
ncbi:MAG: SAV_6107 family HEPN domain-containing protein [Nostocoides sp.]